MYKLDNYEDYLMHHQRQGAHWGIRNGPPYPLNQAFAKTKAAYKKHQEKVAAKKRKKILNDPEKLYKHKDDFSEEEIRTATSKAQAVEELKKHVPQKAQKQKKKKERRIGYATLSMVDTPEKFIKNQIFLNPDERRQALEFLDNRDKADKYGENARRRKWGAVKDFSDLVRNIGSIITGSYSIVDTFANRNPERLTIREQKIKYLYDQFYNGDPDLYRSLAGGKGGNKDNKDNKDKNQNNNQNQENNKDHGRK